MSGTTTSLAVASEKTTALSILGIQATTFKEIDDLAKYVADSELVPKDYRGKPSNVIVAWQLGAELGLQPMQALQNIAVINGRPAVWGDAALALVLGKNILEDFSETFEGEGDKLTAVFRAKRKGIATPFERRFSVADAKTAGLWGKQGPWQQYPKRMLQMRSRGFGLRDCAPDILKGTYLAEELQDVIDVQLVPETIPMPRRASEVASSLPTIEASVVETPSPVPDPTPAPEPPADEPAPSEPATETPAGEVVLVKSVSVKKGGTGSDAWTLYFVTTEDNREFRTFDEKIAVTAKTAKTDGHALRIAFHESSRGPVLDSAEVVA